LESDKVLHSTATLTAQGDIDIASFTAADNSIVRFTSTGGGFASDTWDVDDSDVAADVYGDIAIGTAGISGSTVSLTSSHGGLTSDSWTIDDSDVTANVYGDIAIGTALISGSTVSLTSSHGGLTSDSWTIDDSDVTANVYGDIAIGTASISAARFADKLERRDDVRELDGGRQRPDHIHARRYFYRRAYAEKRQPRTTDEHRRRLDVRNLVADRQRRVCQHLRWNLDRRRRAQRQQRDALWQVGRADYGRLYVRNGSFEASVFGNVEIPLLEAHNATLKLLSTDGSVLFNALQSTAAMFPCSPTRALGCSATRGEPDDPVCKDDSPATASLTLGADNGDIGAAGERLQLDIPAEITVRITQVVNYYLDAIDLPLATYPVYAILGGWDGTAADSLYLTGVYLKYSDEQFFKVLLGANTNEALAAWISQRSTDRSYLDSVDAAALWTLVLPVRPERSARACSARCLAARWANRSIPRWRARPRRSLRRTSC
jgi:hypothetical protein